MAHHNGNCSDDDCFCNDVSGIDDSSSEGFAAVSQFDSAELHNGYDKFDSDASSNESDMDRSTDSDYNSNLSDFETTDNDTDNDDIDIEEKDMDSEFWKSNRWVRVINLHN